MLKDILALVSMSDKVDFRTLTVAILPYESERLAGLHNESPDFCNQCGGRLDKLNTCICGEMIHTKAGISYLPERPTGRGE